MLNRRLIYMDNAATSFPKPEAVYRKMDYCLRNIGANPGRSGHQMAIKADELVYQTREKIRKLFNISDSENIVFTANATMSLNFGLKGILDEGDEVISSRLEHNSVYRPLSGLKKRGVRTNWIHCSKDGLLDPDDIKKAITKKTKLIVLNHASNVTGTIAPIREIGNIAKKYGIYFFVDAAQSAGTIRIDVEKDNVDMLACSGHKGLLGPQGTGILYVRGGLKLKTLIEGGTGSSSESEKQPELMPDRFESGTLNMVGIAGLNAGIGFIFKKGLDKIRNKKMELADRFLKKSVDIKGIKIYGPKDVSKIVPVISFNFASMDPSDAGYLLSRKFGIMTRVGLHCSPLTHKTIDTFPLGTVRVSFGYFNTEEEVDYLADSLRKIALRKITC